MKKYKVGDRVRVRPDLEAGKRYKQDGETYPVCLVTAPMAALAGKVVTIKKSPYSDRYGVVGSIFQWTDEMFEGLAGAEKIVVTTDGETTTARLFSGKELVRSATAKCFPQDEFVFGTGAALALDRLLDREKKAEPDAPKFTKAEPDAPKFTKADLKDGMFIRISDGSWGVIVKDTVVCDDGCFVRVSDLRDDLTWEIAGAIEVVVDGATCFNGAKLTSLSSRFVKYIRPGVEV